MNRIVTENPNWGLNLGKEFHLNFLKKHGLKKTDVFLDYGCGALSSGMHFINYLDANKYHGIDISPKVIEEGKKRVVKNNLENKNAFIKCIDSNEDFIIKNVKFDLIWSQSVFTHLPEDVARRIILNLKSLLSEKGKFYLTFNLNTINEDVKQKNFKDFYFPISFFNKICDELDLNSEVIHDWTHPDDPENLNKLICLTNKIHHEGT
jgi:cyclopropane fatty-acyl-phospholipid synthase-like methyltransferase